MKKIIEDKFSALFGQGCEMFAAPGRINLIGEHTDYNGGYVFPGAIDKCIMAGIRVDGGKKVRLFSIDYDQYTEFELSESKCGALPLWARYIYGVCCEIIKRGGRVEGFSAVFAGDIPLGAGLSSSAALESVFAFALNELFGNGFEKFELATIGQATEHNYCGVKCGIMDQFASLFGRAGSLIRLNCKTMEYKYFPFNCFNSKPDTGIGCDSSYVADIERDSSSCTAAGYGRSEYKLVLLDTCVKHELASSAYNERRLSCERAAAAIARNHPEVEFLSDAKRVWLDEVRSEISQEDFLRAEYVIGEVQRVLDVCDALERGDMESVGEIMYQTHFGMSRLYEVSCPELDFLNKIARKCDVTGSRVMGGGFGGCTINLVKAELYDGFIAQASERFSTEFGHRPKIYDVVISNGAGRI